MIKLRECSSIMCRGIDKSYFSHAKNRWTHLNRMPKIIAPPSTACQKSLHLLNLKNIKKGLKDPIVQLYDVLSKFGEFFFKWHFMHAKNSCNRRAKKHCTTPWFITTYILLLNTTLGVIVEQSLCTWSKIVIFCFCYPCKFKGGMQNI